jgi:8-oxo-dGTP pyrophosphatase MutT (NUDIX family)
LPEEYALVYIRKRRNGEKVIAKGRKDVHEAIPDAAVREAYEETGYKSAILELPTPSLAPGSQELQLNKEAIGVTFRIDRMSRKDKAPIQKLIFWWVSEIDCDEDGNAVERVEGTQLPYENYDVQDMTLDQCLTNDGLTYEPDRKLVAKTKELLLKRHEILTSKLENNS